MMGCASQAAITMMLSTTTNSHCSTVAAAKDYPRSKMMMPTATTSRLNLFRIKSSSSTTDAEEADCNVEECAPDKEVGKVSIEWLAAEKTKVVGTFPPIRKKGWTGYVEKDTAGQTNIYSVEPAVYVADSAISSGAAGSSADGAENTLAISSGLALIAVAAASLILLQVGKKPPQIQTLEYSGPSLSYYIDKFKPTETLQASASVENETSVSVQPESKNASEVSEVQAESVYQPDASTYFKF
ncbi:protein MAINTENANCE OF PSII UNDER HIGH LIGHT 1 isoform X1 [Rhododendron vialii]|uniref:protein MAINTENANCE OF PSII UNDER HIGH LIGHT 1 isoform X1 n=1 Tax=Rhododendron vialii TaxID=182163 RepID=UPI00265EA73F|nr:protein MAINTENANCE OF PSII UNDER HIGH LIGHT 1 isoform X1 [Rhododendron vialii]